MDGKYLDSSGVYEGLFGLFLRGDMKSRNVLEEALQTCTKKSNETVLQRWENQTKSRSPRQYFKLEMT